jgi:hypothetical protein
MLALSAAAGCGVQYDAKTATFYQGKRGGLVMTPQGPVFHDADDVPQRVVFRDPDEPWRPPIGFILPKSGKFTKTSTPTTLATSGLVVVLRSSDTLVPAWGGEILVRVDVTSPATPGTTRDGERVAIVVDDDGERVAALLDVALSRLGARDQLAVIDARGARVLVPPVPATHRSLALAAATQRLPPSGPARDLPGAMAAARRALGDKGVRRVLVLSHTANVGAGGGLLAAVVDPRRDDATESIRAFLPEVGPVVLRDLTLAFEGVPAPARVLEASGGEPLWTLEGSDLRLGDVRAGDARSEVLRVTVPPWISKKPFTLHVAAAATDASSGQLRMLRAELAGSYEEDLERIAESRHGDVIAYASALATLHRLHAAFVGEGVDRVGGLLPLAKMQAQSLSLMARDFPDRGFAEDAATFESILSAATP